MRYRGVVVGRLTTSRQAFRQRISRVLIVGSGPSITRTDLGRAEEFSCVLLNGALHLVPEVVSKPLAVAIEDERFVWGNFDLLARIPAECPCLFSVSVIRAICQLDRTWLQDRKIVLIDDVRKPYGRSRRDITELRRLSHANLSEDGATGFSKDPDAGVFQGGSVAVSAMQFAASWKPKEIGLLGIDISNADEPRFYEERNKAYSGIRRAQNRILDHLIMAKNAAVENGITVRNYSPVSALAEHGFGYSSEFANSTDPAPPKAP